MEDFAVKLPIFEGPFDLLLFFIERDELDIHNIPIAQITQDFLDYLKQLETLNIEVASEFILVASTLMSIKAKMLLPRPVIDETGQEIDPRDDLVKHLLEYKKYKSVIGELQNLEQNRLACWARGNLKTELNYLHSLADSEAEWENLDLYKLLKVYLKVMQRFEYEQQKPVHTIVQYPYTIAEKREKILFRLEKQAKISFEAIISEESNKIAVVFSFLAILEIFQLGLAGLEMGEGYNQFWLIALN